MADLEIRGSDRAPADVRRGRAARATAAALLSLSLTFALVSIAGAADLASFTNPAHDRASAAGRSFTTSNGLIAFAGGNTFERSAPRAPSHIWVVEPDGSGLRQLTHGRAGDEFPAWSPNGEKIAFFRDSKTNPTKSYLYLMNADGTHQRRLAATYDNIGEPTWSPDGGTIAYVDSPDKLHASQVITTIGVNGRGRRRLTTEETARTDPSWSPDGRKIIYISANYPQDDIYEMNPDGSNQRLLASSPEIAMDPRWSPDGRRIAFLGPPGPDLQAIYVMAADGSALRRVTPDLPVYGFGFGLAWSPDGAKLAYTGVAPDGAVDIYTINADGSDRLRVTNGRSVGSGVSWRAGRRS